MALPLVICLMGPTASGKTDLAIAVSQQMPVGIISVDSALVYRGMDIGSAKPSAEEQRLAPHRLIDIRDPSQSYSAAEFCADAEAEMQAITAQGRIPMLVGGTMLYYKALLEGMADMPPADPVIRQQLEQRAAADGWPALHAELAEVDPESAARIHPNHSQRIERALNVYRATGVSLTDYHRRQQCQVSDPRYQYLQFAIAPWDRSILHQRIASRFKVMLENGFIDEVERLRNRGDLHLDLPSMRAVGYRQVWQYLDGDYDYDTLVEKGIVATRQLAKRQLTWLRGWQGLNWLYTNEQQQAVSEQGGLQNNSITEQLLLTASQFNR